MTFRQGRHCDVEPCTIDADWDFTRAVSIPALADPIANPTPSGRRLGVSWVDLTAAEVAEYGLGEGNWQRQN